MSVREIDVDPDVQARLRAELESEREQQLALLDEHGAEPYGDAVRNLGVGNDGFADSGQATEERNEVLAHIELARTRLHQIDHALEQMDEGSYGVCEICGNAINPARLEIRPLSTRCVDCASKA